MSSGDPFSQPRTWDLVAPGYARLSADHLGGYADVALALAAIGPDDRIIDVACGSGNLALRAAERVREVDALDFSAGMLREMEERARTAGVSNLRGHCGDGQKLPFDAGHFDAGFSMFGLMFFPDRSTGFAELFRVVRPGGRAVVASWNQADQAASFAPVFEAMTAELPDMPGGEPDLPLGTADALREEMSAAGFEVEVSKRTFALDSPDPASYWSHLREAFAPIALLEDSMGKANFDPIADRIGARLAEALGPGPVSTPMTALMGLGRRP